MGYREKFDPLRGKTPTGRQDDRKTRGQGDKLLDKWQNQWYFTNWLIN